MSSSYLILTNNVLARLNEVQLTSSNFSNARGIQVQVQNAVNESIRYINQKEFNILLIMLLKQRLLQQV